MNKIFNTVFEISMRLLLMLSVDENASRTLDNLMIADFITNYAQTFGIADSNLHGDNTFRFAELAARRKMVREAIKSLILDNLVTVSQGKDGFYYAISDRGKIFCQSLTSDYAKEYRLFTLRANEFMKSKTETELLTLISRKAAGAP